jgi:hypothetical protein
VDIYFADDVNPTSDELQRWAYTDAPEPIEDFDIILAEPGMVTTLLTLVGDADCPKRRYLLGSLYCVVGHSDLRDARIRDAVDRAQSSVDPWLRTWAQRASSVVVEPLARIRDDWCGWQGLRTRPTDG